MFICRLISSSHRYAHMELTRGTPPGRDGKYPTLYDLDFSGFPDDVFPLGYDGTARGLRSGLGFDIFQTAIILYCVLDEFPSRPLIIFLVFDLCMCLFYRYQGETTRRALNRVFHTRRSMTCAAASKEIENQQQRLAQTDFSWLSFSVVRSIDP